MNTIRTIDRVKRGLGLTAVGLFAFLPLVSVSPSVQAAARGGSEYRRSAGQQTLTGTVTRDLSGDRFEIRADNGRTYRVRVGRYDEPRSLDRGDRVRVIGQFRNNDVLVARSIEFLRDTGGSSNVRRSLTGVVTRDLRGDLFELRADNGRTYRVRVGRYNEPRSLDRGDRVRVIGEMRSDDTFVARDIEFLRDTPGYPGGSRDERTLTGVVTRDLRGDQFELRAENGRT
jgi:translation initiation factor IF-1